MPADTSTRIGVFISYSRADKDWLEALGKHLHVLEDETGISCWTDARIEAGADWHGEIRDAIARAKVAVFLISVHFCASDFIRLHELPALLEAAEKDGLIIVPVFVSPCHLPRALVKFQGVNEPKRTLIEMEEPARQRAYMDVASKIKRAVPEAIPAAKKGDAAAVRKDRSDERETVPQPGIPLRPPATENAEKPNRRPYIAVFTGGVLWGAAIVTAIALVTRWPPAQAPTPVAIAPEPKQDASFAPVFMAPADAGSGAGGPAPTQPNKPAEVPSPIPAVAPIQAPPTIATPQKEAANISAKPVSKILLKVSWTGGGSVEIQPSGLCRANAVPDGFTCSLKPKTSITLVAKPRMNWSFRRWSIEECGTQPSCTLMFSNGSTGGTVQAMFAMSEFQDPFAN